jgi:hypothetical protein
LQEHLNRITKEKNESNKLAHEEATKISESLNHSALSLEHTYFQLSEALIAYKRVETEN